MKEKRPDCPLCLGDACQRDREPLVMRAADFEALLDAAAARGARKALEGLGLDQEAERDIREVRDLLAAWRDAKKQIMQTIVKAITVALLSAIAIGVAVKIKLGAGPT